MKDKFFVIYFGDVEQDPLDRGCRDFDYGTQVLDFISRMENKGYSCQVYFGVPSTLFNSGEIENA